ncbi:hypothetical protein EQ836_25750 [Ectopseudomonas mendocina]|uniref:Uncharacterized protein n=1 Tax=Ectopseudomonas mendocina TaxID=300 RepID=A0ABD7RPU9_ECTME|nr:hypothetical protein [Pseudomonas mendocina]TRO10274.1 hypothetical protein EQ829_22560 [Pseudomonas mendocina]TRO10347.1 hypothetical protein EQ836_25750 [Pseudomonas mendocina]
MNDWKACVGKMSDREVARRFGLGASTVRRFRQSNNILGFCPEDTELSPDLIVQLAKETNFRLAKRFGISIKRIKRARAELKIPEAKISRERFKPLEDIWTSGAIALLGMMPDTEIADRLGVSNFSVKKMRKELGIQAYKRPLPEMTPETISEFAGLSDAEIARRLSVSVSYIRRARIKMEKGGQQ